MIGLLGYYPNKKIRGEILKKKVTKMKQERNALMGLMKKIQADRFKKNIILGLVYNISVKKYKERLHDIIQELQVLEDRYLKITKQIKIDKKRLLKKMKKGNMKVGKSNKLD